MDTARRLLILSCSQRKRVESRLLPAIERYDGPSFRVLRSYFQNTSESCDQIDVFILSAAYGLIPATQLISNYDQYMTVQRANELNEQALKTFADLLRTGYAEICLALSKTYYCALDGWTAFVPSSTSATIVEGTQGVKLARLKYWLSKEEVTNKKPVRPNTIAKPRGVAHLHGIEIRRTPEQVFEHARAALQNREAGAHVPHKWYVQIDNYRVAPKWLVSTLSGLPVNRFTSEDARRVLSQLGIHTKQLDEEGRE
jgi:hypothetical protein